MHCGGRERARRRKEKGAPLAATAPEEGEGEPGREAAGAGRERR
jgi:hypothetical protein